MKICYVGSLDSVHMQRWVRYFARKGHEVDVLTPSPGAEGEIPDVRVHRFGQIRTRFRGLNLLLSGAGLPGKVRQFRRALRCIGPDIVHAHYVNDAALFALLSGRRPFVVTAWGSDVLIAPKRSRVVRSILRFILGRSDLITCDADHMKSALVDLGADPSRVAIIFFGTDVEKFRPAAKDRALLENLSIGPEDPVVISVRRLEPLYDVGTLVRAFPAVLARFPRAKLVIGGSGSEEPVLEALCESFGVSPSVRFAGPILEDSMPRYLSLADAYVSTALSDGGLAASTAEAMACAVPAVVTDVCDNRDWITDGATGRLFPARDAEVLAARLTDLLEDRARAKDIGARGREVIVERNNWAREMERMDRLYTEAVAGRKG